MLRKLSKVHAYPVTSGRVSCPEAGSDIDVDRCIGCEHFLDMDVLAETQVMKCSGRQPEDAASASPGFGWL